MKKRKKKNSGILIIFILLCLIGFGVYYFFFKGENFLLKQNDFDLIQFKEVSISEIDNDYKLDIDEDTNEYFKENLVNAYGKGISLTSSNIDINVNAIFHLQEMYKDFKNNNITDLMIRRGYVMCMVGLTSCVQDHRTGYDVDAQIKNNAMTDFAGYESGDYMIENSYKYGFVLRYSKKDHYEPWHYRYVGVDNAFVIKKMNLTIDKYVSKLNIDTIYQIKELGSYVYKTNGGDKVRVPANIKYEISSAKDNTYIINFALNQDSSLKEIDSIETSTKSLSDIKLNYELILVNSDNNLKVNLSKNDMVKLGVNATTETNETFLLNTTAAENISNFIDDANGISEKTTYVTSSYRNEKAQTKLYNEATDKNTVKKPGTSDHQTGYAADIMISKVKSANQGSSFEGLWLINNAYKYGFVLRYPKTKVNVINASYEPWHFRYVGLIHAKYMNEHNLTLEEYINSFEMGKFYELKDSSNTYNIYKVKKSDTNIKVGSYTDIYYINGEEYIVVNKVK